LEQREGKAFDISQKIDWNGSVKMNPAEGKSLAANTVFSRDFGTIIRKEGVFFLIIVQKGGKPPLVI
jgi:hypothetical protein